MKQELVKSVVRVGNSAGVILPKEWLNGKASVKLIGKPLDIKKDVFGILELYLKEIIGIYIVGSYARGEQTNESDVDILAITEKENKRIVKGKYEILLISEEELRKTLNKNILPLLPMIKEAKPIINSSLIKEYVKTPLTKKNMKFHIETTKSALRLQEEFINLAELEKENVSDGIMYSLILRLRQVYIVDCLVRNKQSNKKDFLKLVRKITGSEEAYEAYVRSKSKEKEQEAIKVEIAKRICNYVKNKIKEQVK